MRGMPLWATSLLTLLVCAYAGREFYPAKKPTLPAAVTALATQTQPKEITAATPEDPGEVAVVSPLAVWLQETTNTAQGSKKPKTPWQAQPMDHIFADAEMPQKYLHAHFALNKWAQFRFVIPPHIVTAKLHGNFHAFVKHGNDDHSGRPANIDLLLMNAEQFDDYIHRRSADTTFELEAADQAVNFALPGAHDQPEEYHLVFRDPEPRANLFVTADFTVNAD